MQQQQQQGNVPWGNRSISDAGGTAGARSVKCDFVGYPGYGYKGVGSVKSVKCEAVEEEEQVVNIKKVRQSQEGWEWKGTGLGLTLRRWGRHQILF